MKTRTRRYAKRQLTWMRKLPGVHTLDVTGRDPEDVAAELHGMIATMKFEKWQALGNDYLIVEAAGVDPDEVRALCDRHLGVGADGVLALAPADEPGYVARLRIYNPDGSEAELSGNGARQALLYLREHGWTTIRHLLDPDRRRRDPHHDHRRAHVPRRHGPRDRALRRGGRRPALPAPHDRQPADADPRRRPRGARAARPRRRSAR